MGRAFGSALLRQDAVGHPGMGVTGKPGAEALNQPGVGISQLGRLAEPVTPRKAVKRKATTGGAEFDALRPQAGLQVVPAGGMGEVLGETRAQGREELLIRPDRRLRALRFIADAIGDHLAHDLTGGHVAPPRQVIDHAQHVGGQFQVQGDHLHPVSLQDQG